jgi:dolichol-phosphate mannosyltransferase
MANKKLVIVMPTYNELINLKILIPQISEVFTSNGIFGSLLIIDDNSPDGTSKYIEANKVKLSNENFKLELLTRPGKLGLGTAYIDGYKIALSMEPDYILGMDADFSHDPKYIPTIFNELSNNDMVIGSRYVKGGGIQNWNLWRKTVSKVASIYAKTMLGWTINDPTTSFVGFRREFLKKLPFTKIQTRGYGFLLELKYMSYKAKAQVKEIPILFVNRSLGESKLNKGIIVEAILNCVLVKFRKYK